MNIIELMNKNLNEVCNHCDDCLSHCEVLSSEYNAEHTAYIQNISMSGRTLNIVYEPTKNMLSLVDYTSNANGDVVLRHEISDDADVSVHGFYFFGVIHYLISIFHLRIMKVFESFSY